MSRPAVVDAHTHVLLPPRVAERVRGFFTMYGFDQLVYPLDPAAVLEALAADGVTEAWTLPYAHRPGTARRFNEHSARAAAEHADGPVAIVPGATVHPGDEDAVELVAEAIDGLGLRVLKLHCSVGQYQPTDPRLRPVLKLCGDRGVPVVVHLGHSPDGTTTADEVAPLAEVAGSLPAVTFIAAHTAHPATAATIEVMRAHPNVYADLTPVLMSPVDVGAAALVEFSDRFLFGSDAPNTGLSAGAALQVLDDLGLDDDARAAITGHNARRLLASA